MKCNMHPLDAGFRAGAGLFLVATPALNLHTLPYNWLGFIPIATALFSYCPLYTLFRALIPRHENTGTRAQTHA